MMSGKDIRGCVVILVLALGLGLGVNSISPAGIPLFGQWDDQAGVLMAGSTREGARAEEVNNPLRVKQMIETGGIVLVDVRRADVYALGHLPGALSFPLSEFDQVIGRFRERIKAEDKVLLYCSGVACHDSHTFGAKLIEMGFARVSVYAGGFSEWTEMEFEVETNEG